MNDEVRHAVLAAAEDGAGRAARQDLCTALATAFRSAGETLWLGGYIIGTDRRDGNSPFGFGSDAVVGLATAVQIAGELTAGAVLLLRSDNLYGAAALIRQMVEIEYLTWAFANDEEEATAWMRSTREQRLKLWQPRHIRERSQGTFKAMDYGRHCELGGHPAPDGVALLPGHSVREPGDLWWHELAIHSVSAWRYAGSAMERFGCEESIRSVVSVADLPEAINRWLREDPLAEASDHLSSS